MDWSRAKHWKLPALVLALVARAARRAAVLVPEIQGEASLCNLRSHDLEELQRQLRDLWAKWPPETAEVDLPRVVHFLAVTEPLWTAADPDKDGHSSSCPGDAQEMCDVPDELQPRWEYSDLKRLGMTRNFSDLDYARGNYAMHGFTSKDTISLVTFLAKGTHPFGVELIPKDAGSKLQHFEEDQDGWYRAQNLLQTTDDFQVRWNESLAQLTFSYQALPCYGLADTRYVEAMPLRETYIKETDSPEACCTLCYAEQDCEVWMWLEDGAGKTGCWLVKDVSGIRGDAQGAMLGRIRAHS
ncbi:AND1 [Symbiodinium natans]|uniref:AND1 protein n=1 Tax=Symbiodinium natans TaxID=878477 RepID=A0A812TZ28_9DINO|nr:AND1 [Symbiodinium natans]